MRLFWAESGGNCFLTVVLLFTSLCLFLPLLKPLTPKEDSLSASSSKDGTVILRFSGEFNLLDFSLRVGVVLFLLLYGVLLRVILDSIAVTSFNMSLKNLSLLLVLDTDEDGE